MHLTRMSIDGVPPFTEQVRLDFDERVNVFVGPNASGKTTIIQLIEDCLNGREESIKSRVSQGLADFRAILGSEYIFERAASRTWGRRGNALAASEDWYGTGDESIGRSVKVPAVYIGSIREGLPGLSDVRSRDFYGKTAAEALAGQFSGSRTMCAFELVGQEALRTARSASMDDSRSRAWHTLSNAERMAGACSKRICYEVIQDPEPHNYIHGADVRGFLNFPQPELGRIPIKSRMGIKTTDVRNFESLGYEDQPSYSAYHEPPESVPIFLGHLSSGTEGTLLWIWWLMLKLIHHYEFQEGWEKQPAILLIDEIENHLHPTWQRRVIPALLEHFPGLQIFATTHSPFVVAGLKKGQVHLLNRDVNGVVTATPNKEDIVGWTADEILRNMMGVDDPTDAETAAAARELRALRNEGPIDDPDAEAKRQERMLELRQRVDRDLLAGGPWAAQRAQFEEEFAEALLKYRQSRDLGQENG